MINNIKRAFGFLSLKDYIIAKQNFTENKV
jgi:hypothetical protein